MLCIDSKSKVGTRLQKAKNSRLQLMSYAVGKAVMLTTMPQNRTAQKDENLHKSFHLVDKFRVYVHIILYIIYHRTGNEGNPETIKNISF